MLYGRNVCELGQEFGGRCRDTDATFDVFVSHVGCWTCKDEGRRRSGY